MTRASYAKAPLHHPIRDSFQQLHSYDPSPVLCSVDFRSSVIRSLLLDLDPYYGNDPGGMFSLFTIVGNSGDGT